MFKRFSLKQTSILGLVTNLLVWILVGVFGALIFLPPHIATAQTYQEYKTACDQDAAQRPGIVCRSEQDFNAVGTTATRKQEQQKLIDAHKINADPTLSDAEKVDKIRKSKLPTLAEGGCSITSPSSCVIALMGWLGSWFLSFGMWILYFAAIAFNALVGYIIVGFGETIQTIGILDGIHTGWEVMRDLANILIVGMFTFIAISMIVGNETFGAKKMVARVLVIAVLINFSLLFSKLIIDVGNFAAAQFYKGMGANADQSISGISDRFLSVVGITSGADTSAIAKKFGENMREKGAKTSADGDTWSNVGAAALGAFLFGIVVGSLFLFAAGVLFYGCYLIMVRAILLVFLMLTSALAFATYLIPQISDSGYGFKTWWKSLINASAFAPLLMALLYVSLVIITPATDKRGSIGALVSDPATGDWKTLIIFGLGIGMLYVSFRVASSFSHQIAGFSMAAIPVSKAFGAGAWGAGKLGRGTLGRAANSLYNTKAIQDMPWWMGGGAMRKSLSGISKSSFDIRSAPGLAAVAKTGGLAMEGHKGGFLEDREKKLDTKLKADIARAKQAGIATWRDERRKGNIEKEKEVLEKKKGELARARDAAAASKQAEQQGAQTGTGQQTAPAGIPAAWRNSKFAQQLQSSKEADAKAVAANAVREAATAGQSSALTAETAHIQQAAETAEQRLGRVIGEEIRKVLADRGVGTISAESPQNEEVQRLENEIKASQSRLERMAKVTYDKAGNITGAQDRYGPEARQAAHIAQLGPMRGILPIFSEAKAAYQNKVTGGIGESDLVKHLKSIEAAAKKEGKDVSTYLAGRDKVTQQNTQAVKDNTAAVTASKTEGAAKKDDH